ncbi:MAG TPA: histidine kinase, partial [Saprospiraceae bacterium]|nr:histidine kinase [Saprospiraceae bacterium]
YLGAQHLREVAISPYDSYCQFSWALPNYFKPDKNQYYVWLEHFEAGWSFLGNTPQVRYNKLPPGRYVLHIRGADSKGNPSAAELTMAIRVRPFFYQTWWFILACGFLLAGAVFAVLRYRLRRLLEMERMRTRIASDLHDEVGSMLSGLAMQVELLELQPQKADATALGRIREISRQALSQMRDVVWSIDSRRDRVQDLLDRMREYCDETLVPRDIAVHFELGVVPMEKKLPVDTRQHLFLFFKEAITNIARHAAATRVEVRFGHFDDYFELSVRDNGSTSAKNAPSTGLGLQNMEMRAGKLGAGFQVSRQDGFEVRLRMKSI